MTERLTPEELWRAFNEMPAPSRTVPFPRSKDGSKGGPPICEVAVAVLTQTEVEEAWAEAEKKTQAAIRETEKDGKVVETQGYVELRKLKAATEILYRACWFPDDLGKADRSKRFFPHQAMIAQKLSAAEVGVLMNGYYRAQHDLGPSLGQMSAEEQLGLIRQLAVGGRLDPLDRLSWGALCDLVRTLVDLIASYTTATSSSGSPPEPSAPTEG